MGVGAWHGCRIFWPVCGGANCSVFNRCLRLDDGTEYPGRIVFLGHQIGSFIGVWLGGWLYDRSGSYDLVWWLGVGLGILCAGGIVSAVIWRSRKGGQDVSGLGVPPHETALQALEALVAEDLIKKGDVKQFYQRISNILRHYIESRFCLRATEQTTEEFLTDLTGGDRLSDRHSTLLEAFLTHCDLVKFAEHQPATRDIQKTFDHCRGFITDTTTPAERPARRVDEPGQGNH